MPTALERLRKEGYRCMAGSSGLLNSQDRTYQCLSDYCHILSEKLSNSNPGVSRREELWNYKDLAELNHIAKASHDYKLWLGKMIIIMT